MKKHDSNIEVMNNKLGEIVKCRYLAMLIVFKISYLFMISG